jgi:hypothetical protein
MNKTILILTLVFLLAMATANAALIDDHVGCWGEAPTSTNTTAVDSANLQNWSATGASWLPNEGLYGTGHYFFNGSNNFLNNSNAPTLSGDATITVWYNNTNVGATTRAVSTLAGGWSQGEYVIDLRDNGVATRGFDCVYQDSTGVIDAVTNATMTANTYEMGACVFDETNSELQSYVNGVSFTNASTDGSHPYVTTAIKVGEDVGGSNDVTGNLYICVWNRSLNQSEIQELYNGGAGLAYPFSGAAPGAPQVEVLERTFESDQTTPVNINSAFFSSIFAATFNTTNTTEFYQSYTIPVISSLSNTMECRILINGTDFGSLTNRTNTINEWGSLNVVTSNLTLANATYTTELQCRRSVGGGIITVANSTGVGHFMLSASGAPVNYEYLNGSGTVATAGLTQVIAFNYTTNGTNTSLAQRLVLDWSASYMNNAGVDAALNTQITINGSVCAEYPRDTAAGATGSVGGSCFINSTPGATYTINVTGTGPAGLGATYGFRIHAKDFFANASHFNTTNLTNTLVNTTTLSLLSSINITNTHSALGNIYVKAGIPTEALNGSTTVTYQLRLSGDLEQNASTVQRAATNASSGVLITQTVFNISTGTFLVELWGGCGSSNCNITGGDLTAYVTERVPLALSTFNVTAFDQFNLSALSIITVTTGQGATFNATGGTVEVISPFNTLINLTVASPGYENATVTNHNTSTDLNQSLLQILHNTSHIFDASQLANTRHNYTLLANFTAAFLDSIINVSFIFNGTTTVGGWTQNTGWLNFTADNVVSPNVTTGSTSNNFTWLITLNNSEGTFTYNFTNTTLTSLFDLDNCSTFTNVTMNFSMINEINNSLMEAELNIYMNITFQGQTVDENRTFAFTGNVTYRICMTPPDAVATINAQMEYQAAGFPQKLYYLRNANISNVTTNINLFLNPNATTVTLTVKDVDDDPVAGAIIKVLSYNFSTNSFRTTEIVETDSSGDALAQLVLDTDWYAFIIEVDGIVRLQTIPTKVTTTSLTFRIDLGTDYFALFDTARDITSSLTFNNATTVYSGTFTDPSGTMQQACLEVVRTGPMGEVQIAETCLTSTAGTINVNITENTTGRSYKGTLRAIFPTQEEFVLQTLTVTFDTQWRVWGLQGIFGAFLIVATIVLSQVWSPLVAVTFGGGATVAMIALGMFHLPWGVTTTLIILTLVTVFRLGKDR